MQHSATRARRYIPALLALVSTVTACSDVTKPVALNSALETKVAVPRYLPYGTPIPESQAVTLPPEPYDPRRHGPVLPNSQPDANVLGKPGYEYLSMPRTPASGPRIEGTRPALRSSGMSALLTVPGSGTHEDRSWNPPSLTQWYGIQVTHEVLASTYNLPSNGELFLLTTPAGYTCLQARTGNYRASAPDTRTSGFFDYCSSGGGNIEIVDATYRAKYVRTINGRPGVTMSIVTPNLGGSNFNGACWYGNLYNYSVGGWEGKASGCDLGSGSPFKYSLSQASVAWFEDGLSSSTLCPVLPGLRATDIFIYDGTFGVVPATTLSAVTSGSGACRASGAYTVSYPDYSVHPSGNALVARTPNP